MGGVVCDRVAIRDLTDAKRVDSGRMYGLNVWLECMYSWVWFRVKVRAGRVKMERVKENDWYVIGWFRAFKHS